MAEIEVLFHSPSDPFHRSMVEIAVDDGEMSFLKYFIAKLNADPRDASGYVIVGTIFGEDGHAIDVEGEYP